MFEKRHTRRRGGDEAPGLVLFEVLADEVESDRAVRNSVVEGILSAIVAAFGWTFLL